MENKQEILMALSVLEEQLKIVSGRLQNLSDQQTAIASKVKTLAEKLVLVRDKIKEQDSD